jgi:hypothetical protein
MQDKKELSPWLKKRLLENKITPEQQKPIGERNSRLMRRVVSRRLSVSAEQPRIPLSGPFGSPGSGNSRPPSNWGEIVLLLSQPGSSQAENEKPKLPRPVDVSQLAIQRPEKRVNRAVDQAAVNRPAKGSSGPRPEGAKVIRGKIEEVAGRPETLKALEEAPAPKNDLRERSAEEVSSKINGPASGTKEVISREAEKGLSGLKTELGENALSDKLGVSISKPAANQAKPVFFRKAGPSDSRTAANLAGPIPTSKPVFPVSKPAEGSASQPVKSQPARESPESQSKDSPLNQPASTAISSNEQVAGRTAAPVFKHTEVSAPAQEVNRSIPSPVRLEKQDITNVTDFLPGQSVPPTVSAVSKMDSKSTKVGEKAEAPAVRRKGLALDFRPVIRRLFRRRSQNQAAKNLNDQTAVDGGTDRAQADIDGVARENPPAQVSKPDNQARPVLKSVPRTAVPAETGGVSGVDEDPTEKISPQDSFKTVSMHNSSEIVINEGAYNNPSPLIPLPQVSRKIEKLAGTQQKSGKSPGRKQYPVTGNKIAGNADPVQLSSSRPGTVDKNMRVFARALEKPNTTVEEITASRPEKPGDQPAGINIGGLKTPLTAGQAEKIELSMPLLAARPSRSRELPVQPVLKPGSSSFKAPGVNREMPLSQSYSPMALDISRAKSSQSKADSGAAGEERIFRQSSNFESTPNQQVNQPPLETVVRRTVNVSEFESSVQTPSAAQASKETPDMKKLARELYPHIKRMIMIEKERLPL